MSNFGPSKNTTNLQFVIQSINYSKAITIFNKNIYPRQIVDLMKMPGVGEEDIKLSLIKGDLANRINNNEIKILFSNINLITFDDSFRNTINNASADPTTPLIGTLIPDQLLINPNTGGSGQDIAGTYTCASNVFVNSVVYLSGPNTVDLADANSISTQPVIGFVRTKLNSTTATVVYYGEMSGFSGLVTSATYYLDITPGMFTVNPPSTPGYVVQKVGFAKDAATMVIMIDRDYVVL